MATRKPGRSRRTAKARSKARSTKPRAGGAKPKARARKAPSRRAAAPRRRERRRHVPETLRLRTTTPSLTVNDLARSMKFYTEALGFVVGERWTDGTTLRGVMLKAGGCEVGLSQDDWAKGRDRQKGVGFRVWCQTAQDVDALAARLSAAGATLTDGPKDEPWGGRSISFDDPDGFHFTIYRES
jgi:uncharacterized glyoxalase superfamily protein PhnB